MAEDKDLSTTIPSRAYMELTPRELEVLQSMANGKTFLAIAADLCLSESTVRKVATSIYSKWHAIDKTHAVAMGFRRRLIS